MSDYDAFLRAKSAVAVPTGIVDVPPLGDYLAPFQKAVTSWALRRGRAGVFAAVGLGKTRIELEFASQASAYLDAQGERSEALILTPLAVAAQTVREADAIGIAARYCKGPEQMVPGVITVTNYDRVKAFSPDRFGVVVLDEASIIKHDDSATAQFLIDYCKRIPFRLPCSATPAPNAFKELGMYAELLGVMTRQEMLSEFFVHDSGGGTDKYRLKGHAQEAFWRWVASWGAMLQLPSDLGFDDAGYVLPPVNIVEHIIPATHEQDMTIMDLNRKPGVAQQLNLTPQPARGLRAQRKARRVTLDERVAIAAEIVAAQPGEQWSIWCELNDESDALQHAIKESIPGCVEVCGGDSAKSKEVAVLGFATATIPAIVSKASIAGYGVNWQGCHNTILVGPTHCYDESTEILTQRGWLTFDKLSPSDMVATVAQGSLAFEWEQPTDIIWNKYSGQMLHFKSDNAIDLLVTPNHDLFAKRCEIRFPSESGRWGKIKASVVADRFRRQEYRMTAVAAEFVGECPAAIGIQMPESMRTSTRSNVLQSIESRAFMQLIGWYVSEGYCCPLDGSHAGQISIAQTGANPENRKEIYSLLVGLGFKPSVSSQGFLIYSKQLATFLTDQCGHLSRNMMLPQWIKDLDASLLEILRDTMLKGDGMHPRKGAEASAYSTTSKRLADDLQEICFKTGIKAIVRNRGMCGEFARHDCYHVQLARKKIHPSICFAPERVDYDGMIGCVTVPNGVVVVRRNGMAIVSGNSFEDYHQIVGRFHRFGQREIVNVHIVYSELEGDVRTNLLRKQDDFRRMADSMREHVGQFVLENVVGSARHSTPYEPMMAMTVPEWLTSEVA